MLELVCRVQNLLSGYVISHLDLHLLAEEGERLVTTDPSHGSRIALQGVSFPSKP